MKRNLFFFIIIAAFFITMPAKSTAGNFKADNKSWYREYKKQELEEKKRKKAEQLASKKRWISSYDVKKKYKTTPYRQKKKPRYNKDYDWYIEYKKEWGGIKGYKQ